MGKTCSLVHCHNRSDTGPKRGWYSIPAIITHQGEIAENLSGERRRLWLAIISRKNLDGTTWVPTKNSFVCSDHFVSGRASPLFEKNHPDWTPSLKLEKENLANEALELDCSVEKFIRVKARTEKKKTRVAAAALLDLSKSMLHDDAAPPTDQYVDMSTEIEWRRRWKPDLKACPWQPLTIDEQPYLIKTKFTQNSYKILLTNLTCFWFEDMSDMALEKRIKKLNPSIEAPVTRILDQIKNCLEGPDRGTKISTAFKPDGDSGEEKILLSISSELAGMPFSWHFTGRPADKKMTSEHLIVPLMAMVAEMKRRQQELINIIQCKDKEIDDYKSQGIRTSRKHIETNPFVETAFENDMLVSKGFETEAVHLGTSAFTDSGQDLYRQIMSKAAWLKRSPHKGDDGDSLLDDSSFSQRRKASSGPSWGNSRLPPSMTESKSVSPEKSPQKSPGSASSKSPQVSPVKNSEFLRQKALERRIEQEEMKKQDKTKKKKKIAF